MRGREGEIPICWLTHLCTHQLTFACDLTRDRTLNLGALGRHYSQLSHLAKAITLQLLRSFSECTSSQIALLSWGRNVSWPNLREAEKHYFWTAFNQSFISKKEGENRYWVGSPVVSATVSVKFIFSFIYIFGNIIIEALPGFPWNVSCLECWFIKFISYLYPMFSRFCFARRLCFMIKLFTFEH